jgi:outer membrane protein assembly factor BamD (BamD/ComL family)
VVAREPKRAAAAASNRPEAASSSLNEENRMMGVALDARNRGDDHSAIELFGSLLARYPDGHFAESARLERMRALKRVGESTRAAADARRYLAEHGGDSVTREEARGIALGENR